MTGWVILVDQGRDLPNAETPHKVISTGEYLARPRLFDMGRPKIVNLARSYAYQSKGYYASLLAEARGMSRFEVTEAGNFADQFGYSTLFVLLAAWNLCHQPQRLLLLVRPVLIVTLFWFALTVATSWDPAQSARRFIFALVIIGIAGMVLLLPKTPRHFADVMAVVVLIVLAACYLGVALVPQLTIHQASDILEPELAGDWRGVFGHKNEASAVMVLFVFIGIFVARVRSLGLGAIIVALALPFLYSPTRKPRWRRCRWR